jgi:ZipA, C-terminal FtsZ-binding domain
MSTLTWVLLIMASIVIGGVLLYNYFTERKSVGNKLKPVAPISPITPNSPISPVQQKVAVSTASAAAAAAVNRPANANSEVIDQSENFDEPSSNEPSIGVLTRYELDDDSTEGRISNEIVSHNEPTQTTHHEPALGSLLPTMQSAPDSLDGLLSEKFDYLVEYALPAAQSGERLLALTAAHRRAGGKPVAFDGMLESGEWVPLQPAHHYFAMRAGLLLANRHGPLNAMEFSDFSDFAQTLATQLDCPINLDDMPKVLNRARDVDRRCAELDAQLGINVMTASPTSPALFAAVATSEGLTERGGGRFAKLDEHGATVFTASFGDQTDRLLLLLDVPRAPANQRPWQSMLQCAMSLAQRLDGQLVDDSGKALPEQVWTQIEEQLRQRYWALEAAGILPGSPRALRLFN